MLHIIRISTAQQCTSDSYTCKYHLSWDNVFLKDTSYLQPTECSALLKILSNCLKKFINRNDVIGVFSLYYYMPIILEDIVVLNKFKKTCLSGSTSVVKC